MPIRFYDLRIWKRQIGSVEALVLARLTGTHRRRAGWLIALAYLLCVLAPTLSFALPGSQAIAHCLTVEDYAASAVRTHGEGMMHAHQSGDAHHHAGVGTQAEPAVAHVVHAAAPKSDSSPAKAPRALDGKCCGMMCVTALPAALAAVTQPAMPKAVRVSDSYHELTDNVPAVHYRPPIS
ncbi:MAG: hypothetical protein ACTHNN_11430 [Xanthobacteraceae bacterium]